MVYFCEGILTYYGIPYTIRFTILRRYILEKCKPYTIRFTIFRYYIRRSVYQLVYDFYYIN